MFDGSIFEDPDCVDVLSEIKGLEHIYYTDCGYIPCKSTYLFTMLNINDKIKSVVCVPCDYHYTIDPKKKFKEVDDFTYLILFMNIPYNTIATLIIPMNIKDVYNLDRVLPNLKSVGFRYIYEVVDIQYITVDLTDIFFISKQYKITIFLYLSFKDKKVRIELARNPELEQKISKDVCNIIGSDFSDITIINMHDKLPSLIAARDNWLFD
uniref:Uncharacterized protein n=1 Tax=Pithovirus LCPAC302 TaxID=2506593 RepID=A0A481Z8F7_9VIRU|nr:MAG: hypothetical protein LCPAC302_00090 [Pithovirus LCPAC302]